MTQADLDAVCLMGKLAQQISGNPNGCGILECWALHTLNGAIRHLAYPDRDVYPKTRRATKGAPIVRK